MKIRTMDSGPGGFPAPRVAPHAAHAFGGIWRLTARRFFTPGYWLTLAGLCVVLVVFSIPAAPDREEAARGFIPWAGGFYVCFLLPILAFLSGAGAMRDDLGAATVDYVFTRSVSRRTYVVFRYLAQMACIQIDFLFALVVVAAIGIYHQVPGLGSAMPLLLLAQLIAVATFSAFGFACGMVTSRYVIVGLAYGAIIEVGIGNVPTQLNQISLVRQVLGILRPILGENDGALTRAALTSTLGTPAIVGVLLLFSALTIALTATLFSTREFAGSATRDA
jgi:ABC-type transport system involved in multi-copper enzyme maturation permease subunit